LLIEFGERYEKAARPSLPSSKAHTYKVDTKKQGNMPYRSSKEKKFRPKIAKSYNIGSTNPPKPQHPKDDSNVSKPRTPADYKARGCVFCGSTMHWDRDCKYSKNQPMRSARSMFVDADCSQDDILAELEYENCYEEFLSLTDQSSQESSEEDSKSQNDEEVSGQSDADDSDQSDF
jgi:hypothetical protein